MHALAQILTLIVAAEHLGFLVLEMFFWTKPRGLRVFGLSPEQAASSRALAANMGLYNGFVSFMLAFSLFTGDRPALIASLGFVIIAGIFGGFTVNKKPVLYQAIPGTAALLAVLFS